MNNYIFALTDLADPMDMIFAQEDHKDGVIYCFPKDDDNLPVITSEDEMRTIMPDGTLIKIKDIDTFFHNRKQILQRGFSKLLIELANQGKNTNDFLKEALQDKEKYAANKEMAIKHKLEYLQTAMKITSIYLIDHMQLEDLEENEEAQEEIRENIREVRRKMLEEEEDDIQNELDLVNKAVRDTINENFPKDKMIDFQIEECTYNGEPISTEDLITKLSNHMLPAFMTQVNILDTLDDTYSIKTTIGTIIREAKTGKITIVE